MASTSSQIVSKAWNFAHVLRDEGLSYMAYTEQITFLLFLKMADEQDALRKKLGRSNGKPLVPKGLDWQSLLSKDGAEL
jgi:type I restriction enzyme M protein